MKDSKLFVISGPSGAGKGTLVSRIRSLRPDLALTISATTRKPRVGEVDGKDYFFLTSELFDELVKQNGFVEWAQVHNNKYGTLKSEVEKKLSAGHSLILEIDPQGAFQVKQNIHDAVLIFITPPSEEVLRQRLIGRGTESEEELQVRLANMPKELEASKHYDVIIENNELDQAVDTLLNILESYEQKSE